MYQAFETQSKQKAREGFPLRSGEEHRFICPLKAWSFPPLNLPHITVPKELNSLLQFLVVQELVERCDVI